MDKFEFGDLNRFLVSLGLALIAGSVALAWLFFREPFDLTVTVETLQKMTPLARGVVERRQALMGSVLHVLPFVSAAGALSGVGLLMYGLKRWIPYQRDYELLQRTTRLRAEYEYHQMTNAEVVENARLDVVAEQPSQAHGATTPAAIDAAVADYLRITSFCHTNGRQCFPSMLCCARDHQRDQSTLSNSRTWHVTQAPVA